MIHVSHLHGTPLLSLLGTHALSDPARTAVTDPSHGLSVTYPELCSDILFLALQLISASSRARGLIGGSDLGEKRVAILCERGYTFVLALLGVWAAGGVAVPIFPDLPLEAQRSVLDGAGVGMILCDSAVRGRADDLATKHSDEEVAPRANTVVVQVELDRLRGVSSDQDRVDNLRRSAEWTRDLKLLDGNRMALILDSQRSDEQGLVQAQALNHSALTARIEAEVQNLDNDGTGQCRLLSLSAVDEIVKTMLPSLWKGEQISVGGA